MKPARHILVVEDDAVAREAMAELLRDEGYEVTTAADGLAAIASVEEDPPALVISDVRMPRVDGFHLIRHLRLRPATAHVPILMVSALDEPSRRIAGLDLGADDYLAKPVDAGELLARVRAQLRRVRERESLERRAVVDPLTGVLNRRGIWAVLHREEQRTRRTGTALSVLVIDIDRFKALNDEFGHQAGDTVLRHVARALGDAVRVADHVGRSGGDEFLLVLPDTDATAAATLGDRLHSLKLPPLAVAPTREVQVTVSVGAATLIPGETIDALVVRADEAMYRNKRAGAGTP